LRVQVFHAGDCRLYRVGFGVAYRAGIDRTTALLNLQRLRGTFEMTSLPNKELLRVDEVAAYFCVARSTVYLWIEHGILVAEKYRGVIRVPRESVETCRLKNKLTPLE